MYPRNVKPFLTDFTSHGTNSWAHCNWKLYATFTSLLKSTLKFKHCVLIAAKQASVKDTVCDLITRGGKNLTSRHVNSESNEACRHKATWIGKKGRLLDNSCRVIKCNGLVLCNSKRSALQQLPSWGCIDLQILARSIYINCLHFKASKWQHCTPPKLLTLNYTTWFLSWMEFRSLKAMEILYYDKTKFTYSLIVSKLKPGFILHGALAQVNGCRGEERKHETWRGQQTLSDRLFALQ